MGVSFRDVMYATELVHAAGIGAVIGVLVTVGVKAFVVMWRSR